MAELIWMEHAETGHRAALPDLPYWRGRGWSPCDGPHPEVDTLHDPVPAPEPDLAPEAEPVPTKRAGKPAKTEKGV